MTTVQKTIVTAAIVITPGAGLYKAQQASTLRSQVEALQQQQATLTEQIQQLQRERDNASNRLALLAVENEALKNDSAELEQVRGELSRLKTASAESVAAKSWLERVAQLKQRMEQTPNAKIPELQFVTEQDWLDAGKRELKTDADYRRALSAVRAAGEGKVASMLRKALTDYMQRNNGQIRPISTNYSPTLTRQWTMPSYNDGKYSRERMFLRTLG